MRGFVVTGELNKDQMRRIFDDDEPLVHLLPLVIHEGEDPDNKMN